MDMTEWEHFLRIYLRNIGSCICADMDMTEWEKMHFRWIYFTTAQNILPPQNARELMPLMHHFDRSCQFILHHTLFTRSKAKYFLWNVLVFSLVSGSNFPARAVMLKSFYEIPEMPDLQYKNAIMSRSVERMEDVCQINIFLLFLLS